MYARFAPCLPIQILNPKSVRRPNQQRNHSLPTLAGLGTGILNMPQCMAGAGVFNAVAWTMVGQFLDLL